MSDRTLARELARRLKRAGVVQVFMRDFSMPRSTSPDHETIVINAFAELTTGEVVQVRAAAVDDLEAALVAWLRNLDLATAPTEAQKDD